MKFIKTSIVTLSYLTTAATAFAIESPVKNVTDTNTIGSIFNIIFTFLIGIVGGLAIIFIVIGGIRYIIAAGDPKATDAAKHTITAALVGLIVALLAVAIIVIVGNILGTSGLNLPGQAPVKTP